MLSRLGLWINSTSNNTKVSCSFSCFNDVFGWISKYFKEILFVKILVLCVPKQCCQIFRQHTWVGHCSYVPQRFLLLKTISCPFCMKTLPTMKSFTSMWTLNALMKFRNFDTWVDEKKNYKSLNAFCCSFFYSKDNSFLKSYKSGFVICMPQAWKKPNN